MSKVVVTDIHVHAAVRCIQCFVTMVESLVFLFAEMSAMITVFGCVVQFVLLKMVCFLNLGVHFCFVNL